MKITVRIIITLLILIVSTILFKLTYTVEPLIQGHAAVQQFQDSDTSYLAAQVGMNITGYIADFFLGIFVISIFFIWIGPIKKILTTSTLVVALFILLFGTSKSYAFYDNVDSPEWVNVQPNQSAFLIPVVGANKSTQAEFESQQYLQENKVAAKRIQIPHTTVLVKSSASNVFGSAANATYYVPSAELFVVDRTPYMREWTQKSTTGTSTNDQSFNFESAESLNIGCDITISAEVTEENAAIFFYHYGCDTIQGDPNDPNITYASVIHGKSLAEVMDTVVRGKVQAVLSREFGRYKMIDALSHKAEIIKTVEDEVKSQFALSGITINYVGYDSSLREDPTIQKSINDVFVAQEKAQELAYLQPVIQVQQLQANIAVTNAIADALPKFADKWGGQLPNLPNWVVIPENVSKSFDGLFKDKEPSLIPPSK